MEIALLGSGDIFYQIAKKIDSAGITIAAVASNKNNEINRKKLSTLNHIPEVFKDHKEIIDHKKDIYCYLMCCYAPLIEEEYFTKFCFINIHYALLPRFRGYHGLMWAMINDEKHLGYSIFKVNQIIDGGDIYFQKSFDVSEEDDINSIRNRIDQHLTENIDGYMKKILQGLVPIKQKEEDAIFVAKRRPEDGKINWDWPSRLIFSHIRALTPPATPGAYSYVKGKKIVLSKAKYSISQTYFERSGKIVNITENNTIYVKCGDGILEITEIIVDEKKYLPGEYFRCVGIQFL